MGTNKHQVGVDVDHPQGRADFASFVAGICAVGFATASGIFDIWNWVFVSGIAAVVGYTLTYVNRQAGVMAVIVSVIAFGVSVYQIT